MKSPREAVAEPDNSTAYADGAFVVELDRFQGPLDLLLHLIREQDVDIFDIPIGQITEQFLGVIRDVERLGLDRAGEFLEMAATLVRIKAQMLLPRRTDALGELEDPRAELVRRLLEYEFFREASLRLSEAQSDRGRHYRRGHFPPRAAQPPVVTELECTWEEVFGAALRLDERPPPPEEHVVVQRAVPIEEKIGLIVQTLARLTRIEFRRLVEPFGDKLHGVVTFMAGLELSKRRQVSMRQSEPFTDIWLYRRTDAEVAAADAAVEAEYGVDVGAPAGEVEVETGSPGDGEVKTGPPGDGEAGMDTEPPDEAGMKTAPPGDVAASTGDQGEPGADPAAPDAERKETNAPDADD